jgi:acetolactate synthase-1/2/3 large subunit
VTDIRDGKPLIVNGAQLLADVLSDSGVRHVIGIPGGTIGAFATTIGSDERFVCILVRNEAVASFAADAFFRVSGQQMAVMLHTSPGIANAYPGLLTAYLDSSAMFVVAGEVDQRMVGRGVIHDLSRDRDADTGALLSHVTKRTWQSHTPTQLIEQALRALKLSVSGRPGPVAISVFEDVWVKDVEVPSTPRASGYLVGRSPAASREAIESAVRALSVAKRPLIVAGNGAKGDRSRNAVRNLAEKMQACVATTTAGKGAISESHPLAVGVLGWVGCASANECARDADAVLVVGARLSDTATGGWQPGSPFDFRHTILLQLDVDPEAIGNVIPVDIPLLGDAAETLEEICKILPEQPRRDPWVERIATAKSEWTDVVTVCATDDSEPLQVGRVVSELRENTRGMGLNLLTDIGNHSSWLTQQFEVEDGDVMIASMGAGSMGMAPCGAIGAALARPDHLTVAWVGDGGMSMASYVLPTLAEYGIPAKIIVLDNGSYSSVIKYMNREFGKNSFAKFDADGTNPDYRLNFASLAESCGLVARQVSSVQELCDGMSWLLATTGPALLSVVVDPASYFPVVGGQKSKQLWGHNLDDIYPWVTGRRDTGSL